MGRARVRTIQADNGPIDIIDGRPWLARKFPIFFPGILERAYSTPETRALDDFYIKSNIMPPQVFSDGLGVNEFERTMNYFTAWACQTGYFFGIEEKWLHKQLDEHAVQPNSLLTINRNTLEITLDPTSYPPGKIPYLSRIHVESIPVIVPVQLRAIY